MSAQKLFIYEQELKKALKNDVAVDLIIKHEAEMLDAHITKEHLALSLDALSASLRSEINLAIIKTCAVLGGLMTLFKFF